MTAQNDNNNAFLLHLSAFFGYIFPFGAVVGPLVHLGVEQKEK